MKPAGARVSINQGLAILCGALCLVAAGVATYLYWQNDNNSRNARLLHEQEMLLQQENDRLKSEVGKLQSEITKAGSLLRDTAQTLEDRRKIIEGESAARSAEEKAREERNRQSAEARAAVLAKLRPVLEKDDVQAEDRDNRLVLVLPNRVLFDGLEPDLSTEGKALVLRILSSVAPDWKTQELAVEGHTESDPVTKVLRGRYPTNWELSSARAIAIVRTAVDAGKVPAGRVHGIGRANSVPVAPGETREARVRNRRIEMIFTPFPVPAP